MMRVLKLKRILVIVLLALLVINVSACNDISGSNAIQEGMPTTSTTENREQISAADVQMVAEGSISCNGNDSSKITYKINQRGEVTLHIEDWNEDHLVSTISLSSDAEIEAFGQKL